MSIRTVEQLQALEFLAFNGQFAFPKKHAESGLKSSEVCRANNTIASLMIILTENQQVSRKLFASETATLQVIPFGICVVAGLKGQNVGVIANEFFYAERDTRLGCQIPRCFEEGGGFFIGRFERAFSA